jgi:hypothetical protein
LCSRRGRWEIESFDPRVSFSSSSLEESMQMNFMESFFRLSKNRKKKKKDQIRRPRAWRTR